MPSLSFSSIFRSLCGLAHAESGARLLLQYRLVWVVEAVRVRCHAHHDVFVDVSTGDFTDCQGLKSWLVSEAVLTTQDAELAAAETADLWRGFVNSIF
jgi:hypothetical protein